jgi:hypothetical protein
LSVKERAAQEEFRQPAQRVLKIVPTRGIEVREEELGVVNAQRLYKLRCECGRSWFELELPKLVKCPACTKLSLVAL